MGSTKARSALADAADRMNEMARTAREQQLAQRGAVRLPEGEVFSTSPDEVWSKRFMNLGIGPTPDCTQPGGYCPMPFSLEPSRAQAPQRQAAIAVAAYEPVPMETSQPAAKHTQIGQAIGKPLRRSFLGRALRRSP